MQPNLHLLRGIVRICSRAHEIRLGVWAHLHLRLEEGHPRLLTTRQGLLGIRDHGVRLRQQLRHVRQQRADAQLRSEATHYVGPQLGEVCHLFPFVKLPHLAPLQLVMVLVYAYQHAFRDGSHNDIFKYTINPARFDKASILAPGRQDSVVFCVAWAIIVVYM